MNFNKVSSTGSWNQAWPPPSYLLQFFLGTFWTSLCSLELCFYSNHLPHQDFPSYQLLAACLACFWLLCKTIHHLIASFSSWSLALIPSQNSLQRFHYLPLVALQKLADPASVFAAGGLLLFPAAAARAPETGLLAHPLHHQCTCGLDNGYSCSTLLHNKWLKKVPSSLGLRNLYM